MNGKAFEPTLVDNLIRLKVPKDSIEGLTQRESQGVEVRVLDDGQPFLRAHGQSVYPELNTLSTVASQAAGLLKGNEADLVVFFGLGLGLHLEFIRKLTNVPIIVFEPDPDLIVTVLGKIPLNIDGVTLVTDISQLGGLVQTSLGWITAKMVVGALPSWMQQNSSAFEEFRSAATRTPWHASPAE